MILIAPDKFKGTLSAWDAASIIASELKDHFCLMAPMADGGEGTARALASQAPDQWEEHDGYFVHRSTRTAAIDSSAWIGLRQAASSGGVIHATSMPLGVKVREILKGGCERVIIGIGGTGTCDGGEGFLQGLGLDRLHIYKERIIGLSDVCAPLVSCTGGIDALSFAYQKGATADDIPRLRERLLRARREWGKGRTSPYDGAGGGLGFAIATAIGAPCHRGAQFVLGNYRIDWSQVEAVITGEGCIDGQTLSGKVVHAVCDEALRRGIPAIAIGGRVADGISAELTSSLIGVHQGFNAEASSGVAIINAEAYATSQRLTPEEAAKRLRCAASTAKELLFTK